MLDDHPCASASQLAALAEGALTGPERDIVVSHVGDCPKCFFIYRNTLSQMDAAPEIPLVKSVGWYWQKFLKWGRLAAAIVVAALVLDLFINEPPPWHTASWWQEDERRMDPADPMATCVQEVFSRVVAAVPQAQGASLLLVEDSETLALAIPGAVVLSRSAAELCLNHPDPAMAEARLALVLGHELAHLAHREYFHGFVAFKRGPDPLDRLRSVEKRTAAEAAADQWGLLYAAQAGFDPAKMLTDKHAFFTQWEARKGGYWDGYPDVAARVSDLEHRVEIAADAFRYFEVGVRFYQIGRYAEAGAFLRTYAQAFAGREVHNNLGLVALQNVIEALAACDGNLVTRFKLPLILDPETMTKSARLRGEDASAACLENPQVQAYTEEAVRHFQQAIALDPGYLPAQLNLASAFLLTHQPAQALAVASALKDSDETGVIKALALYGFAMEKGLAAEKEEALATLSTLAKDNPDAAFNLASIQTELGMDATANWRQFLAAEPFGPFAEHAAAVLDEKDPNRFWPRPFWVPGFFVGPISEETLARLQAMPHYSLHAEGVAEVTVFENETVFAIAQDGALLLVVEPFELPLEEMDQGSYLGARVPVANGFLIVGNTWILEGSGDTITRRMLFKRR